MPAKLQLDVISIFPQYFELLQNHGITRRAYELGLLEQHQWDPRQFANDNYRRIDDRPFGGGPGMVMLYEPLLAAIQAAKKRRSELGVTQSPVILFTPAGKPLTQQRIAQFANSAGAILLCGRYEGIDQRLVASHVDEQISLGDFVLSGGELPALAFLDATMRLLPGVLNDAQSSVQESFQQGLLDHPHFTRPEVIDGQEVPKVLLSGHHQEIQTWRRRAALQLTATQRPDLLPQAKLSSADLAWLRQQFPELKLG